MKHAVIRRTEMNGATLSLGGRTIDLSAYATTGLRVVAVGPSGACKTNAGFLIAEQLVKQGWIAVMVDPEGEISSLYGPTVGSADDLREQLLSRKNPTLVVPAKNAVEFVPYGRTILDVADQNRRPIYLHIDEGQIFSFAKRHKAAKGDDAAGDAADIVNQFSERGRKRALDLFLTAHRMTGSLHRSVFTNKNITLIGRQEDPTAWATLAPQFRGSKVEYSDLAALSPGEFFCFSRSGMEKIKMPMAAALKRVVPKAKAVKPMLPSTFKQWDRMLRDIPAERLEELTDPVVNLLGAVAGLSTQQMLSGRRALQDELDSRPLK